MMELKTIKRDDTIVTKGKCPNCGQWADLDGDQLRDLVSVICPMCEWHGFVSQEFTP
jgi:hypothetical protein